MLRITMKPNSPFYLNVVKILCKSPLFSGLEKKTIQNMLLYFHRETWMQNSAAMNSRQTLERFYILISGRMKVSQIHPDTGRELTVFLLGPGDAFDVISFLDHKEHHVVTTAIDDLEVISAPLKKAHDWIETHPEFNENFLPYLGKQIRDLEELASDLTLHDTLTRLTKLIVRHVDHDHSQEGLKLINDLPHEELAHMIGSVRVVVNRHVQTLKKEGILETSRKHLRIKGLHLLLNKIENQFLMK